MSTLKQINEFLDSQPIALVGVSRNPKKFGYTAFKELNVFLCIISLTVCTNFMAA